MPLFMINDDDFRSKLSEQTLNVDCVVVEAYEDCRLPFCEFILPDLIGNRYKSRLPLGELKVGSVVELKPQRGTVKHLLGVIVPGNYSVFDIEANIAALKACCLNALRHAHKVGAKSIALPPFYADQSLFNADASFAAAVIAADELLCDTDNKLDIYIITNSRQDERETFFPRGMKPENYYEIKHKSSQTSDIDHVENAYRLLKKWGTPKIIQKTVTVEVPAAPTEYKWDKFYDYIRDSGLRDAEIAKKTGVNRSTIFRIMSDNGYKPKVETVIAIAVAMKLSAEERAEFIGCAGYQYPYTDRDKEIEKALKKNSELSVFGLNDILYGIDPDYVLTGKQDKADTEKSSKSSKNSKAKKPKKPIKK